MSNIVYKEESYKTIGICMDVYRELGHGIYIITPYDLNYFLTQSTTEFLAEFRRVKKCNRL